MDKIREFLEAVVTRGERTRERNSYDLNPKASTWYDFGAEWVAGEVLDMMEDKDNDKTPTYIPVLPGRVKSVIKKLRSSEPLEPSLADVQTVYLLEAEGMDRGKAYLNVGAAIVLSLLEEAVDKDVAATVNSKKKQLLHQLQDMGVHIAVTDETHYNDCSYRGDRVDCSFYGWPEGKDNEPYKLR